MRGKRLTPKQEKLARLIVKDGGKSSLLSLGIKAGYSPASVKSGTWYDMANTRIVTIRDALEKQGVTRDFLARKVKEGLSAETAHVVNRKTAEIEKEDSNGNKVKGYKYEFAEKKTVDYRTRGHYVEIAMRANGDLVDKVAHEFRPEDVAALAAMFAAERRRA